MRSSIRFYPSTAITPAKSVIDRQPHRRHAARSPCLPTATLRLALIGARDMTTVWLALAPQASQRFFGNSTQEKTRWVGSLSVTSVTRFSQLLLWVSSLGGYDEKATAVAREVQMEPRACGSPYRSYFGGSTEAGRSSPTSPCLLSGLTAEAFDTLIAVASEKIESAANGARFIRLESADAHSAVQAAPGIVSLDRTKILPCDSSNPAAGLRFAHAYADPRAELDHIPHRETS
jgi:hypothetical protein